MAEQVGPDGHVVAIDLDVRFVDAAALDNLELRQQNVVRDELEESYFDLAHARAVIEHIPERERALERMVAALKPGGWLVLEDVDFGGVAAAAAARYMYPPQFGDTHERIFRAVEVVFARAGAEASFGPTLPGLLQEAGLVDVSGEVRAPIVRGGSEQWVRGTMEQLSGQLVDTGLVTEEDMRSFLSITAEPTSHYLPPFMVAAWGRRTA